jgi:hypothetical protein
VVWLPIGLLPRLVSEKTIDSIFAMCLLNTLMNSLFCPLPWSEMVSSQDQVGMFMEIKLRMAGVREINGHVDKDLPGRYGV